MDKKPNPKVQKIIDVSKSLKGKTLTGQKPNEIEIFTKVTAANNSTHPHATMHNFDFYRKM